MIEPTEDDIGRAVIYTGNRYPGGKLEEGVITSFNERTVFVRYRGDVHAKGTSRQDLKWANEREDVFVHIMPRASACEHDFQGWREFQDGRGGEQVCTKCGMGAMAYSLSVGP